MEAASAVTEETEPVQKQGRSKTVTLYAAVSFFTGFAKMRIAGLPVFFRQRAEVLHPLHGSGILCMNAEPVGYELMIVVEAQILPFNILRIFVKVIQT